MFQGMVLHSDSSFAIFVALETLVFARDLASNGLHVSTLGGVFSQVQELGRKFRPNFKDRPDNSPQKWRNSSQTNERSAREVLSNAYSTLDHRNFEDRSHRLCSRRECSRRTHPLWQRQWERCWNLHRAQISRICRLTLRGPRRQFSERNRLSGPERRHQSNKRASATIFMSIQICAAKNFWTWVLTRRVYLQ